MSDEKQRGTDDDHDDSDDRHPPTPEPRQFLFEYRGHHEGVVPTLRLPAGALQLMPVRTQEAELEPAPAPRFVFEVDTPGRGRAVVSAELILKEN